MSLSETRITVVVEDRRTERFVRRLLESLGTHSRKIFFRIAPAGEGSAAEWVLKQTPHTFRTLRGFRPGTNVAALMVCDGDNVGPPGRWRRINAELQAAGLSARAPADRIAILVPTWSIESWLLQLLGTSNVDELQSDAGGHAWKHVYERVWGHDERGAAKMAALSWSTVAGTASLVDGRSELARL